MISVRIEYSINQERIQTLVALGIFTLEPSCFTRSRGSFSNKSNRRMLIVLAYPLGTENVRRVRHG
jgi:hypothetical protein